MCIFLAVYVRNCDEVTLSISNEEPERIKDYYLLGETNL
jgi:hypothetical protein